MRIGRFARRAVLRAALGAALGALVPKHRVAAAAAGAAAGAAIEQPAVGVPLLIGSLVTRDPVGVGAGIALGALTTRVWPTAPRTAEELRRHKTHRMVAPSTDGRGVVVVVNTGAGSAEASETVNDLREQLPGAEVIEIGEDEDIAEVLDKAATRATTALGAAGGDGTLSAAAACAHDHQLPLLALPAGTLNHFARDLGVLTFADAIDALHAGEVVEVDLATVDHKHFVNTASIGAYADLVEARERLQDRIGKWPALLVALIKVFRTVEPIELRIDGRHRRLWLGFIGNGRYEPAGFAPTWREVLDDGLLDIRVVDAVPPLARTKLLASVLTGTLARSVVYEQRTARSLELESEDGPICIALDGEVGEVEKRVTIAKRESPLRVFAPRR